MRTLNQNPQNKSARSLALDILDDVFVQKRTIDESMELRSYEQGISLIDKAFAYRLASEVVRRKGAIDAMLATFLTKPLKPSQQRVYHAMMIGAVQLCVLNTPAHAAVNETVQVIAASSFAPLKGLVNAVCQNMLRKLESCKILIESTEHALPVWVKSSWSEHYGDAFCDEVAQLLKVKPPIDIAVKSDAEGWAKKLEGEVIGDNMLRLAREVKVEELAGYKDGQWWVQDIGASLAVDALGDVSGKFVLDLCAAPGGKTARLLAKGAKVLAVDSSAKRMERFKTNMARLGYSAKTSIADIRRWIPDTMPDMVLMDAPCSATGTLRKHPEVLWIREPKDVMQMASLQKDCLEGVLHWLPVGVPLVYTVCSLEPEEGERMINDVLMRHPTVKIQPINGLDAKFSSALLPDGSLRLLPTHLKDIGGNDGFYIAHLVKG